jgi:deferrochelatase/peroxidase EfeB
MTMPANEFTAIVNIKPGHKTTLAGILMQIGNPLKLDNPFLQFAPNRIYQSPHRTHFARMVIIPGKDEPTIYPGREPIRDRQIAPEEGRYRLLFSAIFDGEEESFLREVVSYSTQLDEIWNLCEGYTGDNLYGYLQRHRCSPQLFYSTFLHETVDSITRKTAYRRAVQRTLDHFMPDFDAALDGIFRIRPYSNPPRANTSLPALLSLILAAGALIVVVVGGLLAINRFTPVLAGVLLAVLVIILAAVLLPVLITLLGSRDIGIYGAVEDQVDEYKDNGKYYPASMLTGREDVIVQNQFNLYLTFKGNWIARNIRLLRMMILMFVLNRTLRLNPTPGSLAGLTTVHFGHWVLIDGGRRLFFMTNYDGSWENYIADFVNKIHRLLDVQLWSFVGFGNEGTRNITAFRRWLRRVQLQSDVFYSAYPHTTVRNISRDIEINDTCPSDRNDRDAIHEWLKLSGDPRIRTKPEAANSTPYQQRPSLQPGLQKRDWGEIQSIIVYGYANLLHGRYLFLHIDDTTKARRWLQAVVPHLTTVEVWENDDPARQLQTAVNIALTYAALQTLDLPQETLDTFSREFREGIAPPPKGSDNLHPRSINLGDTGSSAPTHWSVGNPAHEEIHLMLLISGKSAAVVDALLATEPFASLNDPESGLRIIHAEQGTTPRTGREPFGFRDGISNPLIEGTRYNRREADGQKGAPLQLSDTEIRKQEADGQERVICLDNDPVVRTGEFILGYPNEYGQIPATPLLLQQHDPSKQFRPVFADYHDFGRNGSYLVYRKLAQDVLGFWQYLADHASSRDNHQEILRYAAKIVGRWPSGTPLVMAPDSDNEALILKAREERNNSVYNNFRFRMGGAEDDPSGSRCPFGSHIRRSHPRDGLLDDQPWEAYRNSNLHRIMRRSAAFGKLPDHAIEPDYFTRVGAPVNVSVTDRPEHVDDADGVGIHFLGINANIQQQFEFIQQAWNNNNNFNGMFGCKDPITGNSAEPQTLSRRIESADRYAETQVDATRFRASNMTIPRTPVHDQLTDLPRFVWVCGGVYLFIPSISALKFIAGQRS